MTFKLLTLVDITPTGVIRSNAANQDMQFKRNQQRNFETVLQVLSLRTQPHILKWPCSVCNVKSTNIKQLFGETFHNTEHTVWELYFTADHPLAYNTNNGELSGLHSDFEQVPIITNLTETARFMLPIFYPYGSIKNIHISKIVN
jgi:hypothetical protein